MLLLTGHTLKDSEYTIQYHRGELLRPDEMAQASPEQAKQHAALSKPPIAMEADLDAVLRVLETAMKQSLPV